MCITMKILLIYPEFPDTFWSFKHAVKFVHKKASNPPLGLATVAALLPREWEKRLIDLNVTSLNQKDLEWADYVFISAMTVQRDSVYKTISACKEVGVKIVACGPLFTGEYEKFPEIDHFILNEGELTIPPFLADLEAGNPKRIYQTDEYADIGQTPPPMWELVDRNKYDSMSIQYSRGCPFNCDFCNVTALLGHRPRTKTADQIIAELDYLYALGWRRSVFFVDDNFIGNKKQLKEEILPALIKWRVGKRGFNFITEASINLADDEELMTLMTKAGFISVFVGIETPDEISLTECHKTQNKHRDLISSVKHLQHAGLQVMGGFIVGFDSDTPTIFQRQIDFIQKSGIVTAMVGILQAPYGTQLYKRLEKEGRLLSEMSGDNVDGSTNIIPKMDPVTLKTGYKYLMKNIYSSKMFYERVMTFLKNYNPPKMPVRVGIDEVAALFKSIYQLGIKSVDRIYYWKLFFWALFRCPEKFPLAITFSIYGFHFKKVSELQNI
jgi:radical SAM superfamily enzyme YgiQ (UPF0313 family)